MNCIVYETNMLLKSINLKEMTPNIYSFEILACCFSYQQKKTVQIINYTFANYNLFCHFF